MSVMHEVSFHSSGHCPGMPTFGSPGASSLNEDIFQKSSRSRLQALYSDFSRQRQSNPTSFHANIEWWRRALVTLVDSGTQGDIDLYSGNRLVLQADRGLLDRLKLEKIGKPLALNSVVVSKIPSTLPADLRQSFVLARMNFALPRL